MARPESQPTASQRPARHAPAHRSPTTAAKWTCWIVGLVFLMLAILGLAGDGRVLGAFSVNTLHSSVHLISGVLLFGLGFAPEHMARVACWIFAAVFALIMILGFAGVMWLTQALNLDLAGAWLYLVMTVVLIGGAGLSHAQERARVGTAAPEPGIRRTSGSTGRSP